MLRLGIDIGGTNIGAGLVDEDLNIIYKIEVPTETNRGYDFVQVKIIKIIEDMIKKANKLHKKLDSIGIGIPGLADKTGDYVISCTNLNWNNVPLGKNLREIFNFPINIENDATLAGIAESAKGVSKGYKNSVCLTIGTGIGGGIIINNKVYSGSHGIGSEIGHMIVGENFYNCNCGNNGCLETFASSTAILKYTINEIEKGEVDTLILKKVDSVEEIDTRLIFQCAKMGDGLSLKAVDRMAKYLSIGIVNIINILDPDIIAIGGGVAKAGDFLLDKINKFIPNYILFKDHGHGKVMISTLGNDAGIIGASMLHEYK